MARVEGSDVKHHNFLQWALSNGIQINGVAPFSFPGRGMGIIATRTIEVSYTQRHFLASFRAEAK
jgi:hypothetical protein